MPPTERRPHTLGRERKIAQPLAGEASQGPMVAAKFGLCGVISGCVRIADIQTALAGWGGGIRTGLRRNRTGPTPPISTCQHASLGRLPVRRERLASLPRTLQRAAARAVITVPGQ